LRLYKKDTGFSYSIGAYPTLELLKFRPQHIEQIYISSRSEQNLGVQKIRELAKIHKLKLEVNDTALLKLVQSRNHFAAAIFTKYTTGLDNSADHLLLVNPEDMGNLGTIIRTMLGFGVKDLALIKPAVDIFDPKVIRASMGAVFQLNFRYFEDFDSYCKEFPRSYYPFITKAAQVIDQVKFDQPATLILGNEGAGLPDNFSKLSQPVRIPQSKNIDSLNLAIAAGIGLRELFKQRN